MGATERLDTPYVACHTIYMPDNRNQTFHRVIERLDFEPSPRLGDALRLFWNDEHRLDSYENMTIRSLGGLSVSLYGVSSLVRPFPYYEEPNDEPKMWEKIREFENKSLAPASGQRIPLASFLKIESIPHSATVLSMKVLPSEAQRPVFEKFALLREGSTNWQDPTVNVMFRIPRERLVLGRSGLALANSELGKLLRPRDKVEFMSEYRLTRVSIHDDDVYVSLRPNLAKEHIPTKIYDSRHGGYSIA